MDVNVKSKVTLPSENANLGRTQAIFITVGLAIVFGGLWLLYAGSGPYHP